MLIKFPSLLPHFLQIVSLLQGPRNCIGNLGRGERADRWFVAVTAFQEKKYRHEASSLDGRQMRQHRLAGGSDDGVGGGCHDAAQCRMPTSTKQVILQWLSVFYELTGLVLTSNSGWRCDQAKLIKKNVWVGFQYQSRDSYFAEGSLAASMIIPYPWRRIYCQVAALRYEEELYRKAPA